MTELPPGQRELLGPAPRFGLPRYVRTSVTIPLAPALRIAGPIKDPVTVTDDHLAALPQTTQHLDLHCVMTWSVLDTPWTGWRFADLWTQTIEDHARPNTAELVFTGLDGYAVSIALGDLLRDEVMLAHAVWRPAIDPRAGAPYRLVVPHLYGYPHVKHLGRIDLVEHDLRSPQEP